MTDSILSSIKKLLGIEESVIQFDGDIIMYINSALAVVEQLLPKSITLLGISDASTTWATLLGSDLKFNLVKTYIFLKVKLVFDPPATAALLEAHKKMIEEHEFRILVSTDFDPPVIVDIIEE